jgi:hypothetical protein
MKTLLSSFAAKPASRDAGEPKRTIAGRWPRPSIQNLLEKYARPARGINEFP